MRRENSRLIIHENRMQKLLSKPNLVMYKNYTVILDLSQNVAQFSSVAQLCPTLCDPMDCSTLGFTVHHQLPKPTQTHVHRIGDAI